MTGGERQANVVGHQAACLPHEGAADPCKPAHDQQTQHGDQPHLPAGAQWLVHAESFTGSAQSHSMQLQLAPPPPPPPAQAGGAQSNGGSLAAHQPAQQQQPVFRQVYRGPLEACEVKGLEPFSAYALRLCAHSESGPSPWSDYASALTASAPPTPPDELSAAPVSCSEAALMWAPPARDYGMPVTLYTVEQSSVPRGGGGGQAAAAGHWQQVYSGSTCSCTASGLAPGRAYQFRVRAANSVGVSGFSAVAVATTLPAPPSAPGRPAVSARTANGAKVRWDEPAHSHGAAVTSYVLQACPAATPGAWVDVAVGPEASVKVTSLQPSTKYLLRAAAANSAGQGPFSECEAVTTLLLPPTAPEGLALASEPELAGPSLDTAGVALVWVEPPATATTSGAIGYEVVAVPKPPADGSGAPPAWPAVKQTVPRRCEARLEGLVPGVGYGIRLRAVGAEGTGHSAWSEDLVVQMPASDRARSAGALADNDAASFCSDASAALLLASGGSSSAAGAAGGAARRSGSGKKAARRAAASALAGGAGPPSTDGDGAAASASGPRGKAAAERQQRVAAATMATAKARPVDKRALKYRLLSLWQKHGGAVKAFAALTAALLCLLLLLGHY